MNPLLVWLLMIPLFNLVWDFFVVAALARSYRAYAGTAAPKNEDFGRAAGLGACCCFVFLWVHVLAVPLAAAGIALTLVYLHHMRRLRRSVGSGFDVIDNRPRRLPV